MRVRVAVLQQQKLKAGRHTRWTSGYTVLASDVPSAQQGGIVLLWEETHPFYEVEAAKI